MSKVSPLVPVAWLNRRLGDPSVVVLDASVFIDADALSRSRGAFRSGLDQYLSAGHIPGARFADLFTEFSDADARFPFMLPELRQFEQAAGRQGLSPETHVITYDRLAGQWASRLWWVLRTLGHDRVSVLDGGLKKYVADGGKLESTVQPYSKTDYKVPGSPRPFATRQDVVDIVANKRPAQLVCVLQPHDYAGEVSVRGRPGHIPGSVNLPLTELLDEADNTVLPPDKLRAAFRRVTPLEGEQLITYCGGGVASTLGALALGAIGYDNTLEYDGSLAEWISDPALPMVTGTD